MGERRDWAKGWLATDKGLFIGSEWVRSASGRLSDIYNPYDQSLLARVAEATGEDVDRAVRVAKSAHQEGRWRNLPKAQRIERVRALGEVVQSHREELATLETLNNGKTYRESYEDDLPESAAVFDYYAGWIDKIYGESVPVEKGFINFTTRDPIGVCALVVPWNFPLLLSAWKLGPALAMGNTVVIKPSPFTPLSLIRFVELVNERGILPSGVLNLVTGGQEAGEALSRHPLVDKIAFTGSTGVGKKIVEAAGLSNLKGVTLELGGKSPNLIFADVKDLDAVLKRSFQAMFSHKGEKCSEPTRFFIESSIFQEASTKLAEMAQGVVLGDPFSEKTQQGPQCHADHFDKIMRYIETGKSEGAKLLAGGGRERTPSTERGLFIRPTIFAAKSEMRIAREEIFGPVLCLIPFDDEKIAIREANESPYGLAAGVYTSDASRAHRVAQALDAGMVFVNHYGCYDFASPFGGVKESGWGKEMGIQSLESYTKRRSIWIRYE